MSHSLKLMCVLAHPDDETLGTGGVLARYGAEGVETYVVTATRGERGWFGDEKDNPGLAGLGRIREAELRQASLTLGVHDVSLLDYVDGDLDQADPGQAIAQIVSHLRRVRPQVVITFDPMGNYGHPDHIAICQFTNAACVCAADPTFGSGPPHRVSKLYYLVDRKEVLREFEEAAGEIAMEIDGVVRRGAPWEDWAITTRIDVTPYWQRVWQAACCHQSQLSSFEGVARLPPETRRRLFGTQTFYRAYSLVNAGRRVEYDLFEGLRP
jgi:LmbE family N-acetylglucosaminyl deacetylase